MAGYASQPVAPTREQAWETLRKYTKSEPLLRHALAVEASTAAYARKFGEDEEGWGITALLHDFDYERWPTLGDHPNKGAEIAQQLEHRVDVADPRHVRERHGLLGEETRSQDREGAVLVARRADAAAEGLPTFDDERVGDGWCDCHGGLC